MKYRVSGAGWIWSEASLGAKRPEVRTAARLAVSGARWRDVSRETEAGSVLGQAMSDEAKISGLTNIGSGSDRARADGSKTRV